MLVHTGIVKGCSSQGAALFGWSRRGARRHTHTLRLLQVTHLGTSGAEMNLVLQTGQRVNVMSRE